MRIPKNFNPPQQLVTSNFFLRKLCAHDVYRDYLAVMANMDIIRKTRGGNWPTPSLTLEDDFIDLAWHQREFEYNRSFTFIVLSPDQSQYMGCVYFYPPNWRKEAPQEADVDVSFWVVQEAYDRGLYGELYGAVRSWLAKGWPFKHPFWTNQLLP